MQGISLFFARIGVFWTVLLLSLSVLFSATLVAIFCHYAIYDGFPRNDYLAVSVLSALVGVLPLSFFVYKMFKHFNTLGINESATSEKHFKELNDQKALFESMIHNLPIPIFYKNKEGIYLGCNLEFEKTFGFNREEIIGKNVHQIAPKEIADRYKQEDDEALASPKTPQSYEFVTKNRITGELHTVKFYKSVFYDGEGNVAGILGAAIDLSVQKTLEEKLKNINIKLNERVEQEVAQKINLAREKEQQEHLLIQQSKMAAIGEMVWVIAHQWKQPLNAIAFLAQTIEDVKEQPELGGEIEKGILDQILFMNQTINDFRSFFSPVKTKQPFCLQKEIEGILELLNSMLYAENIEVKIKKKKALKQVIGYANEFKHVVLNILTNARDACRINNVNNPQLTITFEEDGEKVRASIADNCGGIPTEFLPDTLFEPKFTTKGEDGSGIGLYISKIIIEKNMDGKIVANNKGKGAEFLIELPAV